MNVTRDLQDTLADHSMAEELDLVYSDPENFVPDCVEEIESEYDEFENFERRIKKFEKDLKTFMLDSKDLFFYAILDGLYYSKLEDKEEFEFCQDMQKLADVIGQEIFDTLESKKEFFTVRPEPSYF